MPYCIMSVAVLFVWMSNQALHSCNNDITCLCRAVGLPHFASLIFSVSRAIPTLFFSVGSEDSQRARADGGELLWQPARPDCDAGRQRLPQHQLPR